MGTDEPQIAPSFSCTYHIEVTKTCIFYELACNMFEYISLRNRRFPSPSVDSAGVHLSQLKWRTRWPDVLVAANPLALPANRRAAAFRARGVPPSGFLRRSPS